jgi:hypothetical protein
MKRNNGLRAVVAIAALAGMTSACSSEQPVPYCQVNNNAFLVKMQRTGGTGACTTVPGDQFVDEFLFQRFIDSPTNPAGSIGVSPVVINGEPEANAVTRFSQDLPTNNICSSSEQPVATGVVTVGGTDVPVSYTFTSTDVWVTANAPGTQVRGTVRITETGGCTADYKYFGIAPAFACDDDDGNPDQRLCRTQPSPDEGIPFGSGINPEFETRCELVENLGGNYCVPVASDFYNVD